jgi:hypothetical protein
MSDPEPFYFPDPAMFGHNDAYALFTKYAASLEDAGLERSFPSDVEVRKIAIELLAERCAVEDAADDPRVIADAIVEAVQIRYARRSS